MDLNEIKQPDISDIVVVLQRQIAHPVEGQKYLGTFGLATCVGLYIQSGNARALAHLDGGKYGFANQAGVFIEHCGLSNPSGNIAAYIVTSVEQETPANVKGVEIMLSTYGYSAETIQKIKVPKSEGIVFSMDGLPFRISHLQYSVKESFFSLSYELECITDRTQLQKPF